MAKAGRRRAALQAPLTRSSRSSLQAACMTYVMPVAGRLLYELVRAAAGDFKYLIHTTQLRIIFKKYYRNSGMLLSLACRPK